MLGWLPTSGRQTAGIDATRVTGFFVLDGLLTREWDAAWDSLEHLILPALALASIPFAVVFRITRGAVLDVLDEDYVRTAYAKGLTDRVIRGRQGVGQALAIGFERRDYAVLQVVIIAAAMVYVVVNLVVDLSYAVIDPRVRT
jgi:peptide/nickel transport system permease protein